DDESSIERSAYGWSNLKTPNFDRVAEHGILFTHAFTTAPSCAPSRASVLTGRDFWELEQGAFIQSYLPKKFPLFTTILAHNGYLVGHTGKTWGPGSFLEEGHTEFSGTGYNHTKAKKSIAGIATNDYATNFDSFLKDRKEDQPFFFWAGVHEPHDPHGPENYSLLEKEYDIGINEIQLFTGIEDTKENRQARGNYLYEIGYADLHLGRMLDILEAQNELDNTIVVVTSDNGTPVSRGPALIGKASAYDLGVHIPMALMWPKHVKAGRKVSDFISFSDLAPTFLEVAEINPPNTMSGKSLFPILSSEKSGRIEPKRDFVVTGLEWHGEFDPISRSSRSIRDNRFAYVVHYNNVDENGVHLTKEEAIKPVKTEFYDLQNDPWQLTDLKTDPEYSDTMETLAKKLHQNGIRTKDPRFTGEMDIFIKTRQYVQKRKKLGYGETLKLPYSD
ncbi:MAG: sulfatase, partial [Bacteroidota bacterium]